MFSRLVLATTRVPDDNALVDWRQLSDLVLESAGFSARF